MKFIKNTGLVLFIIGLSIFTASVFSGSFNLTQQELDTFIADKGYKSEIIKEELSKAIVTSNNINIFEFAEAQRKIDERKTGLKKASNSPIKSLENRIH